MEKAKSIRVFCFSGSISSRMTCSGSASADDHLAQQLEVGIIIKPAKEWLPFRRNLGESSAQAAPEKQLVGVKAGKTLQLDQTRDETAVFSRANAEIDLHEKRMRTFPRHDQLRRNRVLRVRAKRGSSQLSDQVARGRLDFPREFRGEKNRRFRNAKIGRPDFGLIHRPDECGVFLLGKVGVELRAKS